MNTEPLVLDKLVSFDNDLASGDLIIKHEQFIPDNFISDLKANKIDTQHERMGDFYCVGSIPVSVVEDLLKFHNFDVMREPVRETLKMLRKLQLDAFITTNKSI